MRVASVVSHAYIYVCLFARMYVCTYVHMKEINSHSTLCLFTESEQIILENPLRTNYRTHLSNVGGGSGDLFTWFSLGQSTEKRGRKHCPKKGLNSDDDALDCDAVFGVCGCCDGSLLCETDDAGWFIRLRRRRWFILYVDYPCGYYHWYLDTRSASYIDVDLFFFIGTATTTSEINYYVIGDYRGPSCYRMLFNPLLEA